MSNIIAFPICPARAPVALVSLDADDVRVIRRALHALGAITIECCKGADDEQTKLDYAACADDAARIAERFERLGI